MSSRAVLRRTATAATAVVAALSTLVGTAAAAGAQELGIDVSSHQHSTSVDWSAVKADGVKFAFVKATEGRTYTNPYYAGDWAGTAANGIYHGAYHFARPSIGSAGAQASWFASKAGSMTAAGTLPPVLDLEVTGGLSVSSLRTWTKNWLTKVESLTGRTPMIYVSPYFWKTYMGNSTAFTRYPLWVAHYNVVSPTVPGGWPTWTFWQGNSSGQVAGISGNVDMNAYNGSLSQLATLARTSVASTPTTTDPTTVEGTTAPAPETPADTTTTDPTTGGTTTGSTTGTTGTTTDTSNEPRLVRTPTTTTLTSNRASVLAGRSVTLSGTVTDDTGAVVAGRNVRLLHRPAGTTTWSRVALLATDATGAFRTSVRVDGAVAYKAVLPRSPRYRRSVSPVVSVAPAPKKATAVSLTSDRHRVRAHRLVKLYGHLTTASGAALSGRKVTFYQRVAGTRRWTVVATFVSVAPTGWIQTYVRPAADTTYRAVYGGTTRLAASRSALVTVDVR